MTCHSRPAEGRVSHRNGPIAVVIPSKQAWSNEGAVVALDPTPASPWKPFRSSRPRRQLEKLLMAISFVASCRRSCGGTMELEGKVNCHLVGSARLPLLCGCGGLSSVLGLPISRNNHPVLLLYFVFILFNPCDARMKTKERIRNNQHDWRQALVFMCAGFRQCGSGS